jgi:DNA polymerase-1
VPVRHGGGGNELDAPGFDTAERLGWIPDHPFEEALRPLIAAKRRHWIGHNLSFDLGFLHRHRMVPAGDFEDTMINAPLLNEHLGAYALDMCCTRAIADGADVPVKDQQRLIDHIQSKLGGPRTRSRMGDLWKLPGDDPEAVDYAEGDGYSTFALWEWQQSLLDRVDAWGNAVRTTQRLECAVIPVLHRMSTRGIRVDQDRLEQTIRWAEAKAMHAERSLPVGLNTRSYAQMAALFSDDEKADAPTTEKGNPSFTKEWLKKSEVGRHVVAAREFRNLLSSFLYPLRDSHMVDGRINPSFSQLRGEDRGTITGRLSATRPNVQAIHKRLAEMGIPLRRLYIPDEGRVWKSVDYSQIEPRLLAHYSKARVLVEGYTADPPVDAHSAVAAAASVSRQHGKTINQLLLTGGGVGALAANLGCSRKLAQELFDQYFKAMPEIKRLQKDAAATYRARGYVRTFMGRICRIERRDLDYKAVNRLLQSGNADIIKRTMVRIDALLDGETSLAMLNNVHDAIDYDLEPSARGLELYGEAIRVMTDWGPDSEHPLSIPVVVDEGEGPDWAIATYGEEQVSQFVSNMAEEMTAAEAAAAAEQVQEAAE